MEHSTAIKRSKLLIHTKTQMNLRNIVLNERSYLKKKIIILYDFGDILEKKWSYNDRDQLSDYLTWQIGVEGGCGYKEIAPGSLAGMVELFPNKKR